MSDDIVHKLIQPSPKSGYLHDQVLCWSTNGAPDQEGLYRARVNTSINEVNCHECVGLWYSGTYN